MRSKIWEETISVKVAQNVRFESMLKVKGLLCGRGKIGDIMKQIAPQHLLKDKI